MQDSQTKLRDIESNSQFGSVKPGSYIRKIHDAAVADPSLDGISSIDFVSSPRGNEQHILPVDPLTRHYKISSSSDPNSFDLSCRVEMPDYDRDSSDSGLELSSGSSLSSHSRPQPPTPDPELNVSLLQSDYYLLKFYQQMNAQLQGMFPVEE